MKSIFCHLLAILLVLLAVSCSEDNSTIFQNDCIKRSIGPNLVGRDIEFAYAMALPPEMGKIVSASVEANIQGAPETWLDHRSYYTNRSGGADIGITIGNPSSNSGAKTEVVFTRDTCAATLRYHYVIPEEARGKEVSFTFSASANNGETVSYSMGPYTVSRMDFKLDMAVSSDNLCFISLEDMTVYNAAEAAANPGKIDLVYLYRSISGISFAHSFVSPGANSDYLPGIALPAGVTNISKIKKAWNLNDRHLARRQEGVYVDDLDFINLDMSNMPDYTLNMAVQSGLWVETQDGKYRAYIFINSVNNNAGGSAVISMKRYAMK